MSDLSDSVSSGKDAFFNGLCLEIALSSVRGGGGGEGDCNCDVEGNRKNGDYDISCPST
jgi:hypothetical protein